MSEQSRPQRSIAMFRRRITFVIGAVAFGVVCYTQATRLDGSHGAPPALAAAAPAPGGSGWTNIFPAFAGNQRLPAHPRLHPQSQAMMDLIYRQKATITGPALDDAQANYYDAKTSDPVHRVHCTERWGPGPDHACVMEGKLLHIPAGAIAGANSDHHVSILDPDGCTVDDFWLTRDLALPTVTVAFGSEINQCTGTGFNELGGGGATAGNGSQRLGRSPLAELRTGVIHHAIEVVPACNNNGPPKMVGQATGGSGEACKEPGPGIPMGAYLWSDITPDKLPPNLDNATRMLCTALNAYGGVVNDLTAGWNGLSIDGLWNVASDPAYAQWAAKNMDHGTTDPGACFPDRDWSHHIHVLAW